MNTTSDIFKKILDSVSHQVERYVFYSPSQVERGDHLKNDPTLGERAWNIPKTTGEFLYTLITRLGSKTGLELGTSLGYSTLWIAAALEENSSDFSLVTIERNSEKSTIAKNLLSDHFPAVVFHTGTIGDYLKTLPENQQFDFIFMDADRGNYREYWGSIQNFLHEKSIVVIDNALREQKSVHEFQNYLINNPTLATYLYELDNGLFIVTKSDGVYSDIQEIIHSLY